MAEESWTHSSAGRREVEIWDTLGRTDPDWGVLSWSDLKHRGWDGRLDEFYASGEKLIESVLEKLPQVRRGRAIDWGSGTGRLTFALAARFSRVIGVDISSSMIETAGVRARERGVANVTFVAHDDFRPQGEADLVVSFLVLQHAPDRSAIASDLVTMAAALALGGFLVVQLPRRATTLRARLQPGRRAWKTLRRLGVPAAWLSKVTAGFGMLLIPQEVVESMIARAGLTLVETDTQAHGAFEYATYFARKEADR